MVKEASAGKPHQHHAQLPGQVSLDELAKVKFVILLPHWRARPRLPRLPPAFPPGLGVCDCLHNSEFFRPLHRRDNWHCITLLGHMNGVAVQFGKGKGT